MSKITNDGLSRSGIKCFRPIAVPMWQVGINGLTAVEYCIFECCNCNCFSLFTMNLSYDVILLLDVKWP